MSGLAADATGGIATSGLCHQGTFAALGVGAIIQLP